LTSGTWYGEVIVTAGRVFSPKREKSKEDGVLNGEDRIFQRMKKKIIDLIEGVKTLRVGSFSKTNLITDLKTPHPEIVLNRAQGTLGMHT